jgi:hypothetical protein
LITVFLLQDWIEEIKVLLASKGNESRIRESYKQMFKKLLDKKGTKSDGIDMGLIRRKFAQVLYIVTGILQELRHGLFKLSSYIVEIGFRHFKSARILPTLDHHV